MISFLKKHTPRFLQEPFLVASDYVYRIKSAFKNPIILTDIYGVRFVVYPYTTMHIRWLLKHGMYDKEIRAMEKLLKPDSIVFDIGANVGIVSALIAKRLVPNGRIYAFEPLPATFQKIRETIALNNFDHIFPYNIAISNTAGSQEFFYTNDASSELNSLGKVSFDTELVKRMDKSVSVETTTLDTFCTHHGIEKIDLAKIDVEGFEREVIEGMVQLLSAGRVKHIQFEVSNIPLQSLGKTSKPIFEFLSKHGYTCYAFDESLNKFTGPINDAHRTYDNYYASKVDLVTL